MRRSRWMFVSSTLAAVLVAGIAPGCRRAEQPREARPAIEEPPARPAELVAEIVVPRAGEAWTAIRPLLGAAGAFFAVGPELSLSSLFGMGPLAAGSFDLSRPVVGGVVVVAGSPSLVVAAPLVSGPELVARFTTGASATHTARKAGALLHLDAAGERRAERSIAVIDDVVLLGPAAALAVAGPYLGRGLARAPASGPPALVLRGPALRERVVPALRAAWQRRRDALAQSAHALEQARGRPADFAEPEVLLAAVDSVVGEVLSVVESAQEARIELVADKDHVRFELRLLGARLENAARLLPTASAESRELLTELPASAVFSLRTRRGADAPSTGLPPFVQDLFGDRLPPATARAVDSTWAALDRARGSEQALALLEDGTVMWTGTVVDGPALRTAIGEAVRHAARPPFVEPFTARLGRVLDVREERSASGSGTAPRRFRVRFAGQPPAASGTTVHVTAHVEAERFTVLLAPDRSAPTVPSSPDPARASLLRAIEPSRAVAALVDLAAFGAAPRGSPALCALALGRDADELRLTVALSSRASAALTRGVFE